MSRLSFENILKFRSWSVSCACKLPDCYLFDWKFARETCDSRAAMWKPQYYIISLLKKSVYFWNRLTKLCQDDRNKEGERLEISNFCRNRPTYKTPAGNGRLSYYNLQKRGAKFSDSWYPGKLNFVTVASKHFELNYCSFLSHLHTKMYISSHVHSRKRQITVRSTDHSRNADRMLWKLLLITWGKASRSSRTICNKINYIYVSITFIINI